MDMLRKLAIVIFILALVLPSALAWMPLTGDHIKIFTNFNGTEGSTEGIVLNPDVGMPGDPHEQSLEINSTKSCTSFNGWHCWESVDHAYIPWKNIYNFTWIN